MLHTPFQLSLPSPVHCPVDNAELFEDRNTGKHSLTHSRSFLTK